MNDIKKTKKSPRAIDAVDSAASSLNTKIISWEAPEFIQYEKGINWYIALFAIGAGLAVLFFWLDNFFGFIAVILTVIVFFVLSRQKPKKRRYQLSEEGIRVNDKLYPLTEFKSFYITFTHNVANIHLEKTSKIAQPITAYLVNVDAQKISEFINQYLPENQKGAVPVNDLFSKWMRF